MKTEVIQQGFAVMIDHIKEELKVYVGIVFSTVVVLTGVIAWASEKFPSVEYVDMSHVQMVAERMAADEKLTQGLAALESNQDSTNRLLSTMISKQDLAAVKSNLKSNESDMFQVEQFMRVNGFDERSEKRAQQLKSEHAELLLRQNCIISGNAVCN